MAGILAMLLSGVVTGSFFYKMFYEPTHMEKNTALGVVLTEEGREHMEVRETVRKYRAMQRRVFRLSFFGFLAGLAVNWFEPKAGLIFEVFRVLITWEALFSLYQKNYQRIVSLKYENQWLEDTAKHMCYMKAHMNLYQKELVSDFAFVPLFLLSFCAFFYPGTREYLQGNLAHGLVFVAPFVILLAVLGVYYRGSLNRNLIYFFACAQAAAMWGFQFSLLWRGARLWQAAIVYVLLLVLGVVQLLHYLRGIRIDRGLAQKEFPEKMPSDGEELWLYGFYRNKRDRALGARRTCGLGISLNRANPRAVLLLLLMKLLVYGITAAVILTLF